MKIFCSITWLIFLTACTGPESNLAQEKENIEMAKQSFADFNAHNWEQHAMHFSDSCKYLDPSYGDSYKVVSRLDKAAKYKKMELWSPDIQDHISSIFASGNKVVIQFISSGNAKSNGGDIKWRLPICCIFTFSNGLIVMDETYYDAQDQ